MQRFREVRKAALVVRSLESLQPSFEVQVSGFIEFFQVLRSLLQAEHERAEEQHSSEQDRHRVKLGSRVAGLGQISQLLDVRRGAFRSSAVAALAGGAAASTSPLGEGGPMPHHPNGAG
jgi:hypothetical protein